MCLRDHDRPGCGGRGFTGRQRGHGWTRKKSDGMGYCGRGPGCGRGGGAERSRRSGSAGDRGGVQSQRLRDGEGDQNREVGQSRLPCSGGDRSRKVGRRRAGAMGCCAAGATKVAELVGAGCWAESPEGKEAWACSATAMAAAVERVWASREARRVSRSRRVRVVSSRARAVSSSPERAVAEWRFKAVRFSRRGTTSRSCSAVARSSACLSEVVLAMWSADTSACASPSSTSWRETRFISACCVGFRLSQMGGKCPRWDRGPSVAVGKARGNWAAGRIPGVRPVPEPVLPRMSVDGPGDRSRGGWDAEGDDEAVLVRVMGAEVVEEDMLREARNGARDEKSRGGYIGSVKGG